jgi:protein-tyrosine-phosphatase
MPNPLILFVCKHNTGRSQMAEAYLRQFAGDAVTVLSAGMIAADRPDTGVVAAMREDGIDISSARPKLLDSRLAARADRVITMGCDVRGARQRVREIRDMVKTRAAALARELLAADPAELRNKRPPASRRSPQ